MIKSIITTIIAYLSGMFFPSLQTPTWELDKSHSSINFAVDHLVISDTTGRFEDYTVDVKAAKDDFSDAVFSFTAKVGSINTNDAKRDAHLKDPEFFDVKKYPGITFKSKSFKKVSGKSYKITGDLTIKGVTKTITFDAKFGGIVKDPWGGTRAGLKIWGEINRFDYGLTYNSTLEAGGLAIGEEVRIVCNVELVKK